MKKSENLGNLIGMSAEWVENNIDKGMWDILIELNKKGYYTISCCEGHLRDNSWNGYIGFCYPYNFPIYPNNFSSIRKHEFYYWDGTDEESRQEFLNNLFEWAKMLPYKAPIEKKIYTLYGKSKKRPTSREKVIISTYDYEDIKAIFNRRDMIKYDLRITESISSRY